MTICHRRVRTEEEYSTKSAQVIASNDDLLMELLLRLPVKSLLKFKSVSKHWHSLISLPHFIRLRYLKSRDVSALYLGWTSWYCVLYYDFVPLHPSQTLAIMEFLDFEDSPGYIEIQQSCKGLFLCANLLKDKYFVYNPTTKHFKTLPPVPPVPPPRRGSDMHVWALNLAFDPSESHFYKIVCILGDNAYHPGFDFCQILIYSSETGCWRVSGAPFSPPLLTGFWTGVYFNGAIHWPTEKDQASLYFDLNEEVIREFPMPYFDYESKRAWRYFGESGGHLHVVDSYQHLTTHLDVYEIERDRHGWFLKFRVDPDVLAGFTMPYENVHLESVLHVHRGENEEDSFMVVHTSNHKVIRYNFISQTHLEIHDMNPQARYVDLCAYQYIESLYVV